MLEKHGQELGGEAAEAGVSAMGTRSTISGHLRASYRRWRDSDIRGSSGNCLRQIASFDALLVACWLSSWAMNIQSARDTHVCVRLCVLPSPPGAVSHRDLAMLTTSSAISMARGPMGLAGDARWSQGGGNGVSCWWQLLSWLFWGPKIGKLEHVPGHHSAGCLRM